MGALGGVVKVYNNDKSLITAFLKENSPLKPLEKNLLKNTNILYRFYLYLLSNIETKNAKDEKREVYSLVGANMSFRRQLLLDIGKFDETFRFGADEEDLFKRLHKQNTYVLYDPFIVVYHNYDVRFSSFLKRYKGYGKGNAHLHYKYKDQNLTIYPYPIILIVLAFFSVISVMFFVLFMIMPFIMYSRWTIKAITNKSIRYITFVYMQMLSELNNNIGIIEGSLIYRNLYKSVT
jgi:GT2 family glycosyltransferase